MSDVVYDTIVAVATPPGRGGISIVRISGNMSLGIADSIFRCARGKRPSEYVSNTVSYGHVVSRSGEVIDEAMLTVMRAPKSYTAEDTVEISCHGGMLPSGRIVELCVEEGARIADPGEFTKRAFLNGRMDLSQAEAVLDIINAETDVSRRIALEQLEGRLSGSIGDIIDGLTEVLSLIELGIDFSDEDVELPGERDIVGKITGMRKRIKALLDTADKGMMLRSGASVVICGRPNVGKSSLMNALLRHDRVIVTPVAGTTRDVVEECLEISGVKVRISDTAGIIDTRDRVELEGIKRSKEKLATADAVIFVLDMSSEMSTQDIGIFDTVKDKKVIVTANKDDLPARLDVRKAEKTLGVESILRMSVREDRGIDLVEKALADTLLGEGVSLEGTVLTGIRHKDAFEKALRCVERAVESYEDGYTAELMASDINEAIYHMNTVTGENVSPDILERIFSKFCIGK